MKYFMLIILTFSLTIPINSFTQTKDINDSLANAYQIAKALVKYQNQTIVKDKDVYAKILGSLIWYADLQDIDKENQKDSLQDLLNKKYKTLNKSITSWKTFLYNANLFFELDSAKVISVIDDSKIKNKLNKINFKIKVADYYDLINIYKKDSLLISQYYSNLLKKSVNIDSINNELKNKEYGSIIYDSLISKIEKLENDSISIQNNINSLKNKIRSNSKNIKSAKDTIYSNLMYEEDLRPLLENLNKNEPKDFNAQTLMVQSLESFTSSNYTIINQQANNEQAKQTISFKMPSEAQMIDAVAIYLAKRVKQEAVLWFFENITKNANKFELLRTIFPSTISLLQSKEVYETPNMGSQWHYALSKDFVTLPKNILNSTWLEKRIPDEKKEILNNLKELPQIAKLINQRYNYQDLVRNMYLELKDTNTSNDTIIKIKDIFTLLYAINNEMNIYSNTKVKDSLSVRKLRYEDFRNINKEEFVIMLSLIDMKYDGIFSKMLKLNTQGEFNLDATQVEQIRKWLGRIQLGIEQLDKVRTEYIQEQKRSESSDKKATIYNSYNIWLFMSELFKLIIPANGSNWLNTTTIRTAESFKYIEQVNEIYNLISTNNFSGSVNSTIDLIDSLFYNNKSKVYKKSFTEIRNLVLDKFKDYQYLTDIVNCIYILKQNITNSNDSIKYSNLKIYFLSSNYTQTKNHNDTIEYYKLKINTCKNKITNNSDKLNTFYIEIGIKKDESNSDTISFERNSQFAALLFEQNRHALIIIRKLGGFLNDVSLAKDSKQLSKVVESYALPPGSYKQKRNKWWSLDLNSFVGPYFGYEFPIKNKILPDAYKASKVYGLSAQIGITISTTIGRKVKIKDIINTDWIKNPDRIKIKNRKISLKTNNTLSLTVSLIDLGAVVSYRLSNSDSILPHDPKWAQIISPGIHIAYGIKNTPLVIQGGFQYTPQLRKIDDKSIRQYNASRIYIGLMFDMPLFNLWSRDRIAY